MQVHDQHDEQGWRVTLAETGEAHADRRPAAARRAATSTASAFMVTYGDGVADIDLDALLAHPRRTAGWPRSPPCGRPSRFGELDVDGHLVQAFHEKPQVDEGWINGGFFVFEPGVLDLIAGDDESLEAGLLARLAAQGQLAVYQHHGFWQCMDTFREMELLNDAVATGGRALGQVAVLR